MIIDRILAATPDNPRFALTDPQAWDVFLGGQPAASGVRVTRETALTYAPWWRGINIISNDVAKLPLQVLRNTPDGRKTDPEHVAWPLLRRQPNEYMTAFTFKKLLQAHALQEGNGYAIIDRDGAARPRALLPLDPMAVTPIRENGVLAYVVDVGLEKRKVAANDMFHVRGLSPDGLQGYSVYWKATESLGLGMGAKKYGSVFFRNNARPNIAIEVPKTLTESQLQDLRKGWESIQGGLENAHKIAILQGGAKLTPFSITAKDSQLLETRQFEIREIALWIGLPPHKLGDATKASYNSLEQENQDYLDLGLDPWLVTWEEECWNKLLSEEEKQSESHEILADRKALVRANLVDRANYYQKATGNRAWMLPDEVRAEEGLELLGGDAGELKDPSNIGAPKPPAEPEPAPPPKRKAPEQAAIAAVLADAARRMVRRVNHAAASAATRPGGFLTWLDSIQAEHAPTMVCAFEPAAGLTGADPCHYAALLCTQIREALLTVAGEAKASELAERIQSRMSLLESQLPAAMADAYLKEQP